MLEGRAIARDRRVAFGGKRKTINSLKIMKSLNGIKIGTDEMD